MFPLILTFDPIMDQKTQQAEQRPRCWGWMEQDVELWIHQDGRWDLHTHLEPGAGKKIKPRQQSPAAEFNMSPASFWSFGTEQAFLNLLFHNEGGFKAVIPYSTILPGTEKVFCILCTAELACCILGTAVAARSNFHYF